MEMVGVWVYRSDLYARAGAGVLGRPRVHAHASDSRLHHHAGDACQPNVWRGPRGREVRAEQLSDRSAAPRLYRRHGSTTQTHPQWQALRGHPQDLSGPLLLARLSPGGARSTGASATRRFFVPSKRLNLLVVGVLAYAQIKYGLRICYATFLSNHGHILVRADSADQVRDFFCLANSQMSKEAQRLANWTGGVFRKRATITEVTDAPEAQVARLRYCMSQGVKEGLCPSPESWPGVQAATAWLSGKMTMIGDWIHRTELYDLEQKTPWKIRAVRKYVDKKNLAACTERLTLKLSPLPCWDDLTEKQRRAEAKALRDSIVAENVEKIKKITTGWRKRIMDEERRGEEPESTAKSNQPRVHASCKAEWMGWVRDYDRWHSRYQVASAKLRRGVADALCDFDDDCFIPSGIFPRGFYGRRPPPRDAPA